MTYKGFDKTLESDNKGFFFLLLAKKKNDKDVWEEKLG